MGRRRRPMLGGLAVAIIVASGALPASAQEPTPAAPQEEEKGHTVALAFRAPPKCPDEAAFRDQVDRRTDRVTWASDGADMRVDVGIEETKKGFAATIKIASSEGETTRNLDGARCDEMIGALGFIAALAADPTVISRPQPPLFPPENTGVPPLPPSVLGAGSPGTPTSRVGRVDRPPAGLYMSGSSDIGPPPLPIWTPGSARERDLSFGIVADAAVDIGATPVPLLGFTGGIAITGELFRARAAFGFSATPSWTAGEAPSGVDAADVSFRLLRGRAEGCVPRFEPVRSVSIFPCARLEIGALTATLERGGAAAGPSTDDFWIAPGLAGLLVFEPAPEVSLAITAGVSAPVLRSSFLDTGIEVFSAWPVVPQLGLEVGVFP